MEERILTLNGIIAPESWFDDKCTPQVFRDELNAGDGDITVWINSPGGDCIAAAQIYNMILAYKGKVTVKIDGIAASAASVIAMAGDRVLMSPVSMLMIHNPATMAMGDHTDMEKAMAMLDTVKDTILNAYVKKTGQSRTSLSHMMDAETWFDAGKAMEMGFCDGLLDRMHESEPDSDMSVTVQSKTMYSRRAMDMVLQNKLEEMFHLPDTSGSTECGESPGEKTPPESEKRTEVVTGRPVSELMRRLELIGKII